MSRGSIPLDTRPDAAFFPKNELRKAFWRRALLTKEVSQQEVDEIAPDFEQRNILLISLRLAGVVVKGS